MRFWSWISVNFMGKVFCNTVIKWECSFPSWESISPCLWLDKAQQLVTVLTDLFILLHHLPPSKICAVASFPKRIVNWINEFEKLFVASQVLLCISVVIALLYISCLRQKRSFNSNYLFPTGTGRPNFVFLK